VSWPHREQLASPTSLDHRFPAAPSVPQGFYAPHVRVDLSSFSELLRRQAPELLPVNRTAADERAGDALPHGTTIVALKYPGGVVMAGDRRSTQGNMIAGRDVQKVYITDDYTATGIAGTAAIAVEFARLYAVELEHYEKLEGVALTFAGKVNRLATMVRGNLGAALQGFVALPLLAGFDLDDPNPEAAGRIVSFDAAGGWNFEDEGYQSVGSGSIFAKSSMKKLYSQVEDADSALRVAVEALYDAADDDSATGGPDLVRGIYPTAVIIGAEGAEEVAEQRIADAARQIIESRSRADTFGPDVGHRSTDARGDS
jgi:proteasome beta subunit